jgi:hypothetical protein
VLDAYGWPHDLDGQALLQRLVDLNAARAAEEASGLVRWLRPEYQNPGGTTAQADDLGLVVPAESATPGTAQAKRPWPNGSRPGARYWLRSPHRSRLRTSHPASPAPTPPTSASCWIPSSSSASRAALTMAGARQRDASKATGYRTYLSTHTCLLSLRLLACTYA